MPALNVPVREDGQPRQSGSQPVSPVKRRAISCAGVPAMLSAPHPELPAEHPWFQLASFVVAQAVHAVGERLALSATMLSADSGGDEQRCCGDLDVGRVPRAWFVDHVLASFERGDRRRAVGVLLMNCEPTGDAQDHFAAQRVHLPHVPGLGEDMHRDQTALDAVGRMAIFVAGVPAHFTGELRFDSGSSAESQMDRPRADLDNFVGHVPDRSAPSAQRTQVDTTVDTGSQRRLPVPSLYLA